MRKQQSREQPQVRPKRESPSRAERTHDQTTRKHCLRSPRNKERREKKELRAGRTESMNNRNWSGQQRMRHKRGEAADLSSDLSPRLPLVAGSPRAPCSPPTRLAARSLTPRTLNHSPSVSCQPELEEWTAGSKGNQIGGGRILGGARGISDSSYNEQEGCRDEAK